MPIRQSRVSRFGADRIDAADLACGALGASPAGLLLVPAIGLPAASLLVPAPTGLALAVV